MVRAILSRLTSFTKKPMTEEGMERESRTSRWRAWAPWATRSLARVRIAR